MGTTLSYKCTEPMGHAGPRFLSNDIGITQNPNINGPGQHGTTHGPFDTALYRVVETQLSGSALSLKIKLCVVKFKRNQSRGV